MRLTRQHAATSLFRETPSQDVHAMKKEFRNSL
jgi:hypothetical protein